MNAFWKTSIRKGTYITIAFGLFWFVLGIIWVINGTMEVDSLNYFFGIIVLTIPALPMIILLTAAARYFMKAWQKEETAPQTKRGRPRKKK